MSSMNAAQAVIGFLSGTLMATGIAYAQTTYYVDDGGTSMTCTGWSNACSDLQTALGLAVSGDQIWVGTGTYKPTAGADRTATFQLITGVAVYGGFVGTEATLEERAARFDQTILSGDLNGDDAAVACVQDSPDCDSYGGMCTGGSCIIKQYNDENSYHVVSGTGTDATAVLDGFTITAGNANGGAWPHVAGGGMFNDYGGPTVTYCTFRGNSASALGGGMYTYAASPTVTNCTFTVNAADFGAGMYNYQASPHVLNSVISGNSAMTHGGGMYNYNYAHPILTNCTFSGNSADSGWGMYNAEFTRATVTNCILWDNLGSEIHNDNSFELDITYSDVQGGYAGTGNVDANPLFLDTDGPDDIVGTADDNLRLMAGSLAIDAGNNSPPGGLPTTDLDGNPRVVHGIVDMGAFERGADCDGNEIQDVCDLDCDALHGGCNIPGCGWASDRNENGVPDSCEMPYYDIGTIPPQTAWHGNTAEFPVHSSDLGIDAIFSIVADPQPFGAIAVDPVTGFFSYTPDLRDKRAFTVTFTAALGGDQVSQDVPFEPMPRLPDEADVLGSEPVFDVLDPELTDYIVRTDVYSECCQEPPGPSCLGGCETFNWELRDTRSVTIAGKTLVFQEGHANGLYGYHQNEDIRELTLFAETVVIRSPFHLPQTDVTIHAKTLRFEDGPGWASIDTTPTSPYEAPDPTVDGVHGLRAGDIRLYVQEIEAEQGAGERFILRGGEGERGGPGTDGEPGANLPTIPDAFPNWTVHTWSDLWDSGIAPSTVIGARFCETAEDCFFWEFEYWGTWTAESVCEVWPDGGDGITGGRPGDGGNGGNLYTNILPMPDADLLGGVAGALAEAGNGGLPGLPTISTYVTGWRAGLMSNEWELSSLCPFYHEAVAGAAAVGPDPEHPVGLPGSVMQDGHSFSWLSPDGVRMVLAHAKDAYLYGHLDYAEVVLAEYRDFLQSYRANVAWQNLSIEWQTEFVQLLGEITTTVHRIENNLDYFGNPAGWVPMLSFEVNYTAFSQEIDRAIRAMYLAYWVGNAAEDLESKVLALDTARERASAEIDEFTEDYQTLVALIPTIRTQMANIAYDVNVLRVDLEALEQRLLQEAQDNVAERNRWKLFCRILCVGLDVIPVGQPALGMVGNGLEAVTNVDPSQPWSSFAEQESMATEFLDVADAWEGALGEIRDLLNNSYLDIEDLQAAGLPVNPALQRVGSVLRRTQAPRTEVEAELLRIKARHPLFIELTGRIEDLNREKERVGRKLAVAMQVTADLVSRISHNVLAIDALNRDITEGTAALDHRVSRYLKEMDRRARERLQKYHYYMAKAYEYRLLRRYEGGLNLGDMFIRMKEIVVASTGEDLDSGDFDDLKAIYEDQLALIGEEILDLYNANPPELSVARSFGLSSDQIGALNADPAEAVTLNLADMGLAQPDEEDIRIVDMYVSEIEVHAEGGGCVGFAYFDLELEHSGESKLRSDGNTYKFAHYTESTENPITWGATFDYCDESVDPIAPSTAGGSLLRLLFGLSDDEALFYSRPAFDSDLSITKTVNTSNGIRLVIDNLRFEVRYDFYRQPSDVAGLTVRVSEDGLLPYFVVSPVDRNGRQDGRGSFYRSYWQGEVVTVEAPASYGSWAFERWTDRYGADLPGGPAIDPALEVELSDNQVIVAQFCRFGLLADVPVLVSCMTGPGEFEETPSCLCVDDDDDGDVDLADFAAFQLSFEGQ